MAMTGILEIDRGLPNGLHDAFIVALRWDNSKRQVAFELDVWVGDLDSRDDETRERHRPARLTLKEARLSIQSEGIVDAFVSQCGDLDRDASTPDFARFFLYAQNVFFEVSYETAELAWTAPMRAST